LKSEIYSDVDSYKLSYEEVAPYINDYDEVFYDGDDEMKPIKAKDLLELDKHLEVVKLQGYPIPEQVIWQAGKGDYSEVPIHTVKVPNHQECGEWIVEQLLANDRGHWGPIEHPGITFSVSGFVHNVIVQARTHRIGTSWDVQSQRYTGRRVVKVANRNLMLKKSSMCALRGSIPIVRVRSMNGPKSIVNAS
jgi:thymidylate synthase ThyX